MSHYDHAEYSGSLPEYQGQTADVRVDLATAHSPLSERKLYARWHNPRLSNHASKLGQEVGTGWHLLPASEFKLLVAVKI